ncbi:MAG: hypothetical protein C0616_07290 [Desulfuromonas sp.]|nr:MAG: hypothetical protein C0616_07290 [Desulfuromonas sp.]
MKYLTRFFCGSLALLLALSIGVPHGSACVGKTLVIGSTGTVQQQVLAQLLAVLIAERTGTSVKVADFSGHAAVHEALVKADIDMYVEYTGVGQVEILRKEAIADSDALFKAVKEVYNQDLNLIWLKPLGFANKQEAPAGAPADAAPVVRKDTLKKFPALARLINKLGGRIDDATIEQLEKQAAGQPPHKVARGFLKQNRLI